MVNASELPAITTISKTLGWLRVASTWGFAFVATVDDDTILNPRGLLRDLYYYPCDIWGSFEIVSFDMGDLTYRGWSDNQEGAMRAHLRYASAYADASHAPPHPCLCY